ncbi:fasciclin domain-containing protein [Gloeobacter kilaueensis]|uniref:Beta-Ig-H3/fasciclin n=1 Tax=Gloeobacter kilaueensis (strain ATCC BAA-2537 / CCAP 1431/1 / ULC 316 / JS1) TaxID=1183438 RepID=U5QI31_GLOK1|nr:fasciclin domain-containing protein [Gloeobacter kilaueensis]AGY57284.1 beta-Ig-H3/fasciclin [Gloeobacter kilaueensis JS1]
MSNIVDTAVQAGTFKTLAAALGAADLVQTLKGNGPFTVFAPTEEAFAQLPAGTIDSLLKPENKAELVKILTYHVVSGKIFSRDIKPGKVKSVQGGELSIGQQGGKVTVNNATVNQADIAADNGVIHSINQVLMPTG